MNLARPFGSFTPFVLAAVLAGAPATLGGCAVHASPPVVGGYATVYADNVPGDIYAYPHVWYSGGYAYWVGDRWYYPSGRGWVILRHEPTELYSYRRTYIQPSAPYGRTLRQPPPPAYREAPRPVEHRPLPHEDAPPQPERERGVR